MRFYLIITIVAVSMYLLLRPSGSPSTTDSTSASVSESTASVEAAEPSSAAASSMVSQPAISVPAVPADADSGVIGRSNIALMLNKLSECTEIKNTVPSGPVEPVLSSVLDSVQAELGEPVIRSEDWNTTEINTADGGKRVIKIETVYEDDDIIKRLKYYQVTGDALVPLELTSEQSVNPSETFLASLEKEGEVSSRERSERVFFQNGEEVTYTERNGKLLNTEIIRAGKSLKCNDYGMSSFKCQCF
mgnify:CR=1 FL=1|tara:strand:+ start:53734 stop:54474 length:741 start_codon:yes stop_codon:yes gene_type:complete